MIHVGFDQLFVTSSDGFRRLRPNITYNALSLVSPPSEEERKAISGYLLRYMVVGDHTTSSSSSATLRAPRLRRELSMPLTTLARAYVRSQLLSSEFEDPSPGFYPASPSLFTPSLCPAIAASSSSSNLNSFVSWYLGMIRARPVLTKSLNGDYLLRR
ncbi:hypothetical protein BHE74_00016283 [Ensete ventricosum]|nr:hypothetical protein BHE74_00016283 [Ensete ventricosum]